MGFCRSARDGRVGFGRVTQLLRRGMVDFLEVVNHRRDIVRRRNLVHEAIAVQRGERILDVGCGPGFFVAELLDAVGSRRFYAMRALWT
jgi:tRNA A58 N-methylase Trm61